MSNLNNSDICFAANRPHSINDSISCPFYIFAPDYRDTSGGIRVLHYLCHILNEMGEEAYILNARTISPRLRTPQLTFSKLQEHFLSGRNPVTIYPEVVSSNPANTPLVARWLLNIPGHLGKPIEFEPKDLIYYYEAWCVPDGISGTPLFIHPVDDSTFNNRDNPDDHQRVDECFYAHKYLLGKKPVLNDHKDLVSLGQEIKRTPAEIAAIFRKAKVLYCYEPSGIISEAQACGCPVLLVRSDYWPLPPDDTHHKIPGLAVFGEDGALNKAQDSLKLIPGVHAKARDNSWAMTKSLVENVYHALDDLLINGKPLNNDTQKLWALSTAERKNVSEKLRYHYLSSGIYFKDINSQSQGEPSFVDEASKFGEWSSISFKYQDWLAQRYFLASDTKFLGYGSPEHIEAPPQFQLIIQLPAGQEGDLADTLDSLGSQIHENWTLDVISSIAPPNGVEDVPNLNWHTLDCKSDLKRTLDFLAKANPCHWLIEIPVGARLDILYLWRLAKEIFVSPDIHAFFVDDDCCDNVGKRHSPRFKPGTNPAYLQSTDIAGPLCVRKDIWFACGGAGEANGSPWFGQLLRIAGNFGWQTIKHIPDVLITYPNTFPTNTESCQLALREFLNDGDSSGEIIDATAQSWNIRYSLGTTPPITIAILSQGQQEMISRCLDSIIKITTYPEYEILIVTNELPDDPIFNQWLHETEKLATLQKVRIVFTHTLANHASRSNRAIETAENDFVLLIRDEAVIVQDRWLEELVRTVQQTGVAASSPLLHRAGDAKILASGKTLGLLGENESPYANKANLDEPGYLDYLKVTRDVTALPSACILISKSRYQEVGGMDELALGDYHADTDLCLKLRKEGFRLIVQPRAGIVFGGETSPFDLECRIKSSVAKMDATRSFLGRWDKAALVDPFWNPNLSLLESIPTPEIEYRALWQYLPSDKPRILANPLGNGQGDFRVISPLSAVRKAGLATECVWRQRIQGAARYFTAAEIARLDPSAIVIQNYIHDIALAVLKGWSSSHARPFTVYALDDLIDDLDKTNPFRKHIPPNARSRLKYALAHCDRLVVSTEFLAEIYQPFIPDIKVVPNRLEQDIWGPLNSLKRTGTKPRVGWAGGSTHQGDLILLKEIIEKTRNEADWIFFGMCPEEIRPLLAEFHDLVPFDEYPKYLASLNLDIAVAPLAQTPFNQGKSNLRLLEYGALGIPVICTDIDPYHNSPACRVANTPNAWVAALRERIYDPEAREREGLAMREWVLHHYMLEEHLEEWLSAHLPSQ